MKQQSIFERMLRAHGNDYRNLTTETEFKATPVNGNLQCLRDEIVNVGDSIRSLTSDLYLVAQIQKDHRQILALLPYHLTATITRQESNPRNAFGRSEGNEIGTAADVPIVFTSATKAIMPPNTNVQRGDILHVGSDMYLVREVSGSDGLLILFIAQCSGSSVADSLP